MLPTFIGIGTAKAGTTWLFRCLEEHPEVFLAPVKETGFFFRGYFDETNLKDYERYFAGAEGARAVGEITAYYFHAPETSERIHRILPDARLFVVLRNPADQIYSHYWHLLRQNFHRSDTTRWTFEQAMEKYDWLLIEPARYNTHLQRWLKLFPRQQVHIIFFDDIQRDPEKTVKELYGFLQVTDSFLPAFLGDRGTNARAGTSPRGKFLSRVHAVSYSMINAGVYQPLRKLVGHRGAERIKETLRARQIFERLFHRSGYPKMNPQTRAALMARFAEEIAGVSRLTGRDLSHWK